ncbi:MAG: hypothetical protein ABW277_27240 [Longimicrobiaceae bacterium]
MTRRTAIPLLLALACLCAPPGARAQAAPRLRPSDVPARGARAADFVPRGWREAARVTGDLDRDGRPDTVLHLVAADTPDDPLYTSAPEGHALVVLLARADGSLRRGGVAPELLETGAPQYGLELEIRNGVLVAGQSYGMTWVVNMTHRFRHDPASSRFLLIGRDQYTYTRPLNHDDTVLVSENYLTGVRLTTTGHVRDGIVARESTRREAIPRARLFMEDVSDNTSDDP